MPGQPVLARLWARLHGAGKGAADRVAAYDRSIRHDPRRRERTAMVIVGVTAGVALLALGVLFAVVAGGEPPTPAPITLGAPSSGPPSTASTSPSRSAPPPTTPSEPAGGVLRSLFSGRCVVVPDGSRQAGTPLVQRPCSGEGFHLVPVVATPETYLLVDDRTGQCVDISGASTADGAPAIQWDCHGKGNQQFTLRPVPGQPGWSQLVAGHSGKCLDVANQSAPDEAAIQQWTCHPADTERQLRNQSWALSGTQ